MFIAKFARPLHVLALGIVLPLAAGCSAAAQPSGSEDPNDSTLSAAGGATTVGAAAKALQTYASLATLNASVSCSSANGAAGEISIIDVSTGKAAGVAGAAAAGPVTVGTATGTGGVALGAAATWDAATSTFDLGGALVGQIVLPVTGAAPTDTASANAAFEAAFGSGATYGLSLTNELKGLAGKTIGFYASGPAKLTGHNGDAANGTVAIGVLVYEGKVVAIQTAGLGSMASYVE